MRIERLIAAIMAGFLAAAMMDLMIYVPKSRSWVRPFISYEEKPYLLWSSRPICLIVQAFMILAASTASALIVYLVEKRGDGRG